MIKNTAADPTGLGVLDHHREGGHGRGAGLRPGHAPGNLRYRRRRAELAERGVDVSEVKHFESGGWVPGPDPQRRDYSSFVFFNDPDGNSWIVQQGRQSEPGK